MTTEAHTLSVSGVRVAVVRKAIRNLHLGVYPPDGRVRVAAPLAVSDAAVRVAVIGKLRWIRRQQAAFEKQERQPERRMVSGEDHYFLGRRLRLEVVETDGRSSLRQKSPRVLLLQAHRGSDADKRLAVLQRWYRGQLRTLIPPLIKKWEKKLDVRAADWGIKRMKTKWGSCNPEARRIWVNLELAKKAPECLEYIVVHELAHLREQKHGDAFIKLMDAALPQWRAARAALNKAPLAEESWGAGPPDGTSDRLAQNL